MAPSSSRPQRGFTILEAMIALTILLIGLVGMLHFLIQAARSDRAAKAQTVAAQAAQELLTGLQGLALNDPLLTPNAAGATPPATFGRLLSPTGTVSSGGLHQSSEMDTTPIPGVRTDAQLAAGPEASLNLQRRWVVWNYVPTGVTSGTIRVISVSVVYTDLFTQEVVLYGQRTDLGSLLVQSVYTG